MIGMPVRVEAGPDTIDARSVELVLDLFRGVEENIGAVYEGAGAAATVGHAALPGLPTHPTRAARLRGGDGAAGSQDLDSHGDRVPSTSRAPGTSRRSESAHTDAVDGIGQAVGVRARWAE
jgi:hypothetical protein